MGITNTIVGNFGISVCWGVRLLQEMVVVEVRVVEVVIGMHYESWGGWKWRNEHGLVVGVERGEHNWNKGGL